MFASNDRRFKGYFKWQVHHFHMESTRIDLQDYSQPSKLLMILEKLSIKSRVERIKKVKVLPIYRAGSRQSFWDLIGQVIPSSVFQMSAIILSSIF